MSDLRGVSVLRVDTEARWLELAAHVPDLDARLGEVLGPLERVVAPDFEATALPALRQAGLPVLVRHAHRDAETIARAVHDHQARIDGLLTPVRKVFFAAQRHALERTVVGLHAWDPLHDADAVRTLVGSGLLIPLEGNAGDVTGRYRLTDDLPPPPSIDYDFEEAVMDETDDLSEPREGPLTLLSDLASLAAALLAVTPRRTLAGPLTKADARKLASWLGDASVAEGKVEDHPRWGRALQALEALGAVSTDPISREVYLDLGLDETLLGTAEEAVDRFAHRLVDRALHVVVPAVREAIRQAGPGAIDELVFLEMVHEQHREILFPRWRRPDGDVYPHLPEERARPWDERGWDRFETPMILSVLGRLERLGLIRRAEGIFAGTHEGRVWAGALSQPPAPIWVSSDLEILVPPFSLTPWERLQVERLCRCLGRDVADRFRLERGALEAWLAWHDVDEAISVLERRSPAVPRGVADTMRSWARSAERVVLTRGVLLPA